MRKKFKVLPVSEETYESVVKKQIELTPKRNKSITLFEVSTELIRKGLKAMEEEDKPTESIIIVEGKVWNLENKGMEFGNKNEVKQNESDVKKV